MTRVCVCMCVTMTLPSLKEKGPKSPGNPNVVREQIMAMTTTQMTASKSWWKLVKIDPSHPCLCAWQSLDHPVSRVEGKGKSTAAWKQTRARLFWDAAKQQALLDTANMADRNPSLVIHFSVPLSLLLGLTPTPFLSLSLSLDLVQCFLISLPVCEF